jgi:hypothetical protein
LIASKPEKPQQAVKAKKTSRPAPLKGAGRLNHFNYSINPGFVIEISFAGSFSS